MRLRWNGRGSASRRSGAALLPSSYSTSFALTENPISEGGIWVNGAATGLKWNNVQTSPGLGYAASFVTTDPGTGLDYTDPIAHLSTSYRTFAANQYAQGTVYRAAGYSPGNSHEIELLLRFSISANDAHGYEVLWAHDGTLAVVRWNGGVGNYNDMAGPVSIGQAVTGDILYAQVVGDTITAKKNGATVATVDLVAFGGTIWSSGQPGMGFFPRNSGGVTLSSYGWSSWQAGDL